MVKPKSISMITKKDYEADLRKFRDFCRKNPFLIGCYVYVLVDPRGEREQVFYVGKGTNDRMFQHVLESFNCGYPQRDALSSNLS